MGSKTTPLGRVKAEHGDKEKLVSKVIEVIDLGDEGRDEAKSRLSNVSNKKLLRLLAVGQKVKESYGSTDKLAEAVAGASGRGKDGDFVTKLKGLSAARLLDLAKVQAARTAAAERKAAKPVAKAEAPAPAKKAAAKKPAAKATGTKAKAAAKKPAAAKAKKAPAAAAKKPAAKGKTTKK